MKGRFFGRSEGIGSFSNTSAPALDIRKGRKGGPSSGHHKRHQLDWSSNGNVSDGADKLKINSTVIKYSFYMFSKCVKSLM